MARPRSTILLGLLAFAAACSAPRERVTDTGVAPATPDAGSSGGMRGTAPPTGSGGTGGRGETAASGGQTGTVTGTGGTPMETSDAPVPTTDAAAPPPITMDTGAAPPAACTGATRRCGDGVCRANDVAACGATCDACKAPANAAPICDTVRCDFQCAADFLRCDDRCLPRAGGCCTADDCATRESAEATCESNKCVYACVGEAVACGDTCIGLDKPTCCGADAKLDGDGNGKPDCEENMVVNGQFTKDTFGWRAEPSVSDARLEWSPMDGRGAAGSGSVKVTNIYTSYPFSTTGAGYKRQLDLTGGTTYTISADYYIPPGQTATGAASVELNTNNTGFYESIELGRVVGAWTRAKVTAKVLSPDRISIFRIDAVKEGTTPFIVYFDNVVIRR